VCFTVSVRCSAWERTVSPPTVGGLLRLHCRRVACDDCHQLLPSVFISRCRESRIFQQLLPRLLARGEVTEELSSKVDVCEKRNTTRKSSVKLYKYYIRHSTRSAYCTADSVNIINSDVVSNLADRLYRPLSTKTTF